MCRAGADRRPLPGISINIFGGHRMSVATINKAARNGRQAKGSLKPGTNGKKPRIPKTDYLDPAQLLNVLDAVRRGDFSLRLPDSATGETGAIYDAFNEIIERNERLTAELNRISDVVGREGRISDRAAV